jgi:hypothetical protein
MTGLLGRHCRNGLSLASSAVPPGVPWAKDTKFSSADAVRHGPDRRAHHRLAQPLPSPGRGLEDLDRTALAFLNWLPSASCSENSAMLESAMLDKVAGRTLKRFRFTQAARDARPPGSCRRVAARRLCPGVVAGGDMGYRFASIGWNIADFGEEETDPSRRMAFLE